ncbi:MAG: metal-dependent hydrolase [Candidatus Micrarchaeota archaeon]
MPLTPFHWGIAFLGLIFRKSAYIPALLISSVLIDLEPFYYLFIAKGSPILHGFFHTYLGATLVAMVVAFLLVKIRKQTDGLMANLKVPQSDVPNRRIYLSTLFAAYSHIFLDSFLYKDMQPYWPLTIANPFLGIVNGDVVYLAAGLGLMATTVAYGVILLKRK